MNLTLVGVKYYFDVYWKTEDEYYIGRCEVLFGCLLVDGGGILLW